MITIKYYIKNNMWFKNNKRVSQKSIKNEVSEQQFMKLKTDGKLTVRIQDEVDKLKKKEKKLHKEREKNLKVLNSIKKDYNVEKGFRHGEPILEVWRKNHTYGYYNFAFYLDNLDNLDEYILKDVKKLEDIKKNKKEQKIDDII